MSFGDKLLAKVASDIERVGWSAIGVFPTEDDEQPAVGFTYSIGFQEHEHPEVVVIGLPNEVAHGLLHVMYEKIASGKQFTVGERYDEVLGGGYQVEFAPVPPDGSPLNVARAYYGVEELPALQMLWPDKEGRFPGEDDYGYPAWAQDLEAVR